MFTSMFQIFFRAKRCFFMTCSKKFVSYFYNHNKILYNKFEFLENYCIYPF